MSLAQCCGRYCGPVPQEPAPDAESLMRSRYTAYAIGDEAYVLATWHASTRPSQARFEAGTKWLGLQVHEHRRIDEGHAEVEFVARWRIGGRAHRLHERSRFVRENGRWYYVDGDIS
jgi:SEC-C motif-containing protein